MRPEHPGEPGNRCPSSRIPELEKYEINNIIFKIEMALLRERGRNTETIEYRTGRFVSGCQMVQYSNDGLKTGLKNACL